MTREVAVSVGHQPAINAPMLYTFSCYVKLRRKSLYSNSSLLVLRGNDRCRPASMRGAIPSFATPSTLARCFDAMAREGHDFTIATVEYCAYWHFRPAIRHSQGLDYHACTGAGSLIVLLSTDARCSLYHEPYGIVLGSDICRAMK